MLAQALYIITRWQERDIFKYMLESGVDNHGIFEFQEFKEAIKFALKKMKIEKLEESPVCSH